MAVTGGTPITLCDAQDVIGADWGDRGTVFFGSIAVGLTQVSAQGGEPSLLLTPDKESGELDFHYPQIFPGGRDMLVTRHDDDGTFGIESVSLETGRRKRLIEDAFDSGYTSTGHLVYAKRYALFAAPFDSGRLEVTGPSVPVVEDVDGSPKDGELEYGLASDGALVYFPRASLPSRRPTERSSPMLPARARRRTSS